MAGEISPHFDLPFRFLVSGGVAQSEQDSFDDVCNCVEAICRTPLGFRVDNLDFGFANLEMLTQPILSTDVMENVGAQETRAAFVFTEQPDQLDILIDRITVEIGSQ